MAASTQPTRPRRPDAAPMTHLLGIAEIEPGAIEAILDDALAAKARFVKGRPAHAQPLAGKSVTMLFEKPSLRTRMSFEIGLTRLGAQVVYLDHSAQRLGERESLKDYAKNLERWTDAIVARVHAHGVLEELARHASIPVVNALSDAEHPCQALADLLTIRERFGSFEGVRVAYLGDGNNVCHSLMLACAKVGVSFTAIAVPGHEPASRFVELARNAAAASGATVTIAHDPGAVAGHSVVYTDTWVSMGEGGDADAKRRALASLQVSDAVMARAAEGSAHPPIFMHCLPAHRGEEVADSVIDSEASAVYDQAENRMHAQNALMTRLLASPN
ncbi:MAG: ornithine carbamoyltransferase [Phycisphaerales bacterium JB037]